ncbi:MAG: lecithin retinol acyltransferase family protein [Lachnospiraceae bacterium]|nr:lecithin retinol acyltransferase family protein [Lachnospiraceae bacterium]
MDELLDKMMMKLTSMDGQEADGMLHELLTRWSNANIKFPTLGGEVFWNDLAECNGWRLQRNTITEHVRILDAGNNRRAWGDLESLISLLSEGDILKPVRGKKEIWAGCRRGDVIATERMDGVYLHYAVYIGDGNVIHYSADGSDFVGECYIHEASFYEFLRDSKDFYILDFKDDYERRVERMRQSDFSSSSGLLPANDAVSIILTLIESINRMNYHLYSPEETVQRARSKLGEKQYNLVFNNCEHLAVWCKTGLSESRQINDLIRLITKCDNEFLRQIPYLA